MDEPNHYAGTILCADFGKPLILYQAHTTDASKNNFACSTYNRFGKQECSSHYLRESLLSAVVLVDLKRVTHFERQEEALFAQHDNLKIL